MPKQVATLGGQPTGAVLADQRLIDRCLGGDQTAWDDLYRQCQPTIISAATAALKPRMDAREVSDEIAARVWVQLISHNCRLLKRFDVQRGCRLQAFIARICLNQVLNFRKAERRRRSREVLIGDSEHFERADHPLPSQQRILHESFLASLTPREREFCQKHLLETSETDYSAEFSASNVRQLRSRISRKLRTYLAAEW